MFFWINKLVPLTGYLLIISAISSCAAVQNGIGNQNLEATSPEKEMMLTIPELESVSLDGRPLRVVATTSIIGDIVAQVGGDDIELITLINPGQDPHSFEPGAGELAIASEGDVIFVNGWNLEEGLVDNLSAISGKVPVIPVSASIEPLGLNNDGHIDPEHGSVDPHTWFSVSNVQQWVENITFVLSALDPQNAQNYERNGQAYHVELQELDKIIRRQIETIPVERRTLVTNHDSFGYFADAYEFQIVGTIMSSSSTLAEPSAGELAGLIHLMQAENVCTIFTETSMNDDISQTIKQEIESCDQVEIIPLYSGSLGLPGSGAESYVEMMKANVSNIVKGLS